MAARGLKRAVAEGDEDGGVCTVMENSAESQTVMLAITPQAWNWNASGP
jgi:hypothetical protein